MGKIKVRTIGGELEELEKKEQKKKSGEKKLAKEVPVVEASEEKTVEQKEEQESREAGSGSARKKAKFQKPKHVRSKNYLDKALLVDKNKKYSLNEAIELLEKMQSPAKQDSALRKKTLPAGRQGFDETVELHLNTSDPKIKASTTLPHGTGKSLKVAIASDELITKVEEGKVDFDILLSSPNMMPKLAKIAKILGPKGLMPNPKNGTIVNNPEEAAKKYEGGLTFIKTESKAPIIHVAVGKVSFGPKKLEENISAVIAAVQKENIEKAILKSTMSPAIKLSL